MVSLTRERITVIYVVFLLLFGALLIVWAVGLLWWLSSGELFGAPALGGLHYAGGVSAGSPDSATPVPPSGGHQ